jgi:dTDP-4-dehydrorhamnose reductase
MKILITGSDGQIGWELLRAFPPEFEVLGTSRAEMDIALPSSIRACIARTRPDLIINAAAYTAVDRAEVEPALAHAINATAVGVLGEEARSVGAAVIHFSTDYIFDGTKRTPYLPTDQPNPQSVYGATKLEGEQLLRASGASHLILRTCWVYGTRGRNFLMAILRQASLQSHLRVVDDQTGCPTWSRMAARVTAAIVRQGLGGERGHRQFNGREGVYHLASRGQTTWFNFARAILERSPVDPAPTLTPVSTVEYGARAARPAYSVLDCANTENTFRVLMDHWEDSLQTALQDTAALQQVPRGDGHREILQ